MFLVKINELELVVLKDLIYNANYTQMNVVI